MRDPTDPKVILRRAELDLAAAQSAVDILATCVTSKRFKARDNEVARERARHAVTLAEQRYREIWVKSREMPVKPP